MLFLPASAAYCKPPCFADMSPGLSDVRSGTRVLCQEKNILLAFFVKTNHFDSKVN